MKWRVKLPVSFYFMQGLFNLLILPLFRKLFAGIQRRHQITRSLNTPEGRTALATSMTEPIRRALDYQSLGRRLLMVDELPQATYARYINEVANTWSNMTTSSTTFGPISYTFHVDYPNDSNGTITNSNNNTFQLNHIYPSYNNGINTSENKKYSYDKEEKALNEYLIKNQEIKEEKLIEDKRKEAANSIAQLQLED